MERVATRLYPIGQPQISLPKSEVVAQLTHAAR
jgi:hypothetical protein